MYEDIRKQASEAVRELFEISKPADGEIFVVGCSSSEIVGERIGHGSNEEVARAVFEELYQIARWRGVYLAAQCCEHLNRAIVLERSCMERYGFEEVCVMPQVHAGGSFATAAYELLPHAVVVESIKAHCGMDIGDTLIGMHLKRVAVPVRISVKRIGEANVVCAGTRPMLIGGARACYPSTAKEANRS